MNMNMINVINNHDLTKSADVHWWDKSSPSRIKHFIFFNVLTSFVFKLLTNKGNYVSNCVKTNEIL